MIKAYAAKKACQKLEPYEYVPKELGPYDIEVAITHCGICHSDISLIDNEWNTSIYPLVPGHEIVGHIVNRGDSVQHLSAGQRVGIGWQRSCCFDCEWCHTGEENLCFKQEATCVGHPGGYADRICIDSRFAFPIPEHLPSEQVAPLFCGGITVFSPLLHHDINPTHRVGIIGIGGLGHLAIQFAKGFGCEVTAFSSSPDKKQESARLGAHHFISSVDSSALKSAKSSFDFLLCTIPNPLDWQLYVDLLRPKGTLCFVGAQTKPISLTCFSLLTGRKTVTASNIGSRPDITKMLHFAANHNIRAEIELFPMHQVNEAIDKVRSGQIRYRAVLTSDVLTTIA